MPSDKCLRRVLVLAMALAAAGCTSTDRPVPLMRIGHALHDHHAPLFVAAALSRQYHRPGQPYLREVRYREEYELKIDREVRARVVLAPGTGGMQLVRQLSEDHVDLVLGGFPAMVKQFRQVGTLRVIAPVMVGGSGLVLARGIAAADWNEFTALARSSISPLRIGYKTTAAVQVLALEQALSRSGIPFTRDLEGKTGGVVLVNLHGPGNLLSSLESRLVDGFVAMQPYLAQAEAEGMGRLVAMLDQVEVDGQSSPYPCCAVATQQRFIDDWSEVLEDLLVVFLQAADFLQREPDQAAEAVAGWLGTETEVERRSLPTIRFTLEFDPAWRRGARGWALTLGRDDSSADVGVTPDDGTPWSLLYTEELLRRARARL